MGASRPGHRSDGHGSSGTSRDGRDLSENEFGQIDIERSRGGSLILISHDRPARSSSAAGLTEVGYELGGHRLIVQGLNSNGNPDQPGADPLTFSPR